MYATKNAPLSGYYFGLGRWENRCGYLANLEFHSGFSECEFPLEELEPLRKKMEAISIPLGTSMCALDGTAGVLRVYHGDGYIDIFHRTTEQPQWEPLLASIRETRGRYLPDTSLRFTPRNGPPADRLDVPL